ncbi:type II TA system antitoxin MqsA family protein (plasmid) [Pseudomonas silesiensis]|uniref:type II TA system antitoxin MqsA family protein n=1 Tax=Pseudomonas silesiensis TaxID=1853130 RepID=UPI0030D09EE8
MLSKDQCVACGHKGTVTFTNRSFAIAHKYVTADVHGISGVECSHPECKEIVFNPDDGSAVRYSESLDRLIARYRGHEMRRIRGKLGLTQKQMVERVCGGGHNAVSRYEKGEICVPTPLWVLIVLLDKKPELLAELSMKI